MQQLSTRAIVLRRVSYGEADLIVTLFSLEHGKLAAFAKSARKSQRRFGGALEIGTEIEAFYTPARSGSLVRLERCDVINTPIGAMRSIESFNELMCALDLANGFVQEGLAAPDKFELLSNWIHCLNGTVPQPKARAEFLYGWISACGYRPSITDCASCGSVGIASTSYDLKHGGFVCSTCFGSSSRRIRMSNLGRQGFLSLGTADSIDADWKAVSLVLIEHLEHLLGRNLVAGI